MLIENNTHENTIIHINDQKIAHDRVNHDRYWKMSAPLIQALSDSPTLETCRTKRASFNKLLDQWSTSDL